MHQLAAAIQPDTTSSLASDQVVSTMQQDFTQCDMHCCVVLLCDAHNLITVPRKESCQAFELFLVLFLVADVVKIKSVRFL